MHQSQLFRLLLIVHLAPSWSTGIAQAPFTKTVADNLPNQYHKKALEVESATLCDLLNSRSGLTTEVQFPFARERCSSRDSLRRWRCCECFYLEVVSFPCADIQLQATVETNLTDHLLELVDLCDKDNNGFIDFKEFEHMLSIIRRKFPASENHLSKVRYVWSRSSV